MPSNEVQMGWGALPMKEQHPILSDHAAAHFDEDNAAISRLLLRGLLTHSQASAARLKYVKKVGSAIREAIAAIAAAKGAGGRDAG